MDCESPSNNSIHEALVAKVDGPGQMLRFEGIPHTFILDFWGTRFSSSQIVMGVPPN